MRLQATGKKPKKKAAELSHPTFRKLLTKYTTLFQAFRCYKSSRDALAKQRDKLREEVARLKQSLTAALSPKTSAVSDVFFQMAVPHLDRLITNALSYVNADPPFYLAMFSFEDSWKSSLGENRRLVLDTVMRLNPDCYVSPSDKETNARLIGERIVTLRQDLTNSNHARFIADPYAADPGVMNEPIPSIKLNTHSTVSWLMTYKGAEVYISVPKHDLMKTLNFNDDVKTPNTNSWV